MKPPETRRWRPIRILDLAALALGGLLALFAYSLSHGGLSRPPVLVARHTPPRGPVFLRQGPVILLESGTTAPGRPDVFVWPVPPDGSWSAPFPEGPFSWNPDDLRPTDRCLVPAPQIDSRFVVSKSAAIDPKIVVPPGVAGLPSGRRGGLFRPR